MKQLRADLLHQLGGRASPAEAMLVERAVVLSLCLRWSDRPAGDNASSSSRRRREYLAAIGSLRRVLPTLGLKQASQRPLTPSEAIAAIHAQHGAKP